jgi:hypothetical protein
MKTNADWTRRRFLANSAPVLSVPLAVAGASVPPVREDAPPLAERRAGVEDVNAIRELQRTYARLVNARAHEDVIELFADPSSVEVDRSIRNLSADGFGEEDVIELSVERRFATGRFTWIVQTETEIGPDCTLVEMARAQGEGFVRTSERRVIDAEYVKQAGVWKIRSVAYRPVGQSPVAS